MFSHTGVKRMQLTDTITYTIPVSLADAYRGHKTIVRTHDPPEITTKFSDAVPEGLCHIRLLSLDGDIDDLKDWAPGIPIDLVIRDPRRELPLLYRYAPLLPTHPLRVSVPLVPGFGAVVKLAVSLNFSVTVEGGQPDQSLTGEMMQIAGYYLHRATVTEPIEFFHSLFLAFYHRDPVTLWAIQEEDPLLVRYVTDSGEETMPGRLAEGEHNQGFSSFMQELQNEIATGKGECAGCGFLMNCLGYFKWPRKEYHCDGVKALMRTLLDAAGELRRDVASFQPRSEGDPS
jgi:hypothetical protein